MGLIGKLLFAPFASYFILMLYAAVMSTFLGYEWMKENKVLTTEYVVILSGYYSVLAAASLYSKRRM